MFIFYRGHIINTEGLKNVYYLNTSKSMRLEYSNDYVIFINCPLKEAETDLQKIFEMLKKNA